MTKEEHSIIFRARLDLWLTYSKRNVPAARRYRVARMIANQEVLRVA